MAELEEVTLTQRAHNARAGPLSRQILPAREGTLSSARSSHIIGSVPLSSAATGQADKPRSTDFGVFLSNPDTRVSKKTLNS
jgi:hypothetical protein